MTDEAGIRARHLAIKHGLDERGRCLFVANEAVVDESVLGGTPMALDAGAGKTAAHVLADGHSSVAAQVPALGPGTRSARSRP